MAEDLFTDYEKEKQANKVKHEKQVEVPKPIETQTEVKQQEETKQIEISTTNSNSNNAEIPLDTTPLEVEDTQKVTTISTPAHLGVIDGISLMEMEFPPPAVIVKNLLHTGFSIIGGNPKAGKTWFGLSLSIAVAIGTDIIGFDTNKSEVLYLSLECKFVDLQHRLKILLQGKQVPNGLHFYTEIKTLDNGLLDFLQNTLNQYPKIKLIIIDPLQFIRSSKSGGGTLYQKEYKEMSMLKEFADKNNVCILAVHHLKNTQTKDVFAKMYGSNGIRGCTNTNIVMIKEENTSNVQFHVESRDVESTTKIIQRNSENCRWEVISDNTEETAYNENPIVITIRKMLEEKSDGIEIKMADFKDRMINDLEVDGETYSPQSISREISGHLIPLFMRYDNIRCKKPDPNGGVKGRVWNFYYEKPDEVSENDDT
jgi:hypothetical protein